MLLRAVVFDMDGLLIDSEPLWEEAGIEFLEHFGVRLTKAQYQLSTGLRTREWLDFWFSHFGIDSGLAQASEDSIVGRAIEKIRSKSTLMPGAEYILSFFKERNFRIGLATSSPVRLIEVAIEKFQLGKYFDAYSSAENLTHSKPHPQVFLDCLEQLSVGPLQALCFEDSFNGMIAAKAARMKCVVVPAAGLYGERRWGAADLELSSLQYFTDSELQGLSNT
jgi:mannitol-1-/sugar-/sorbitol-6-/2-deoxyglucose-6-phosphatase